MSFRISYRLSLAVAIPAFVVVTGTLLLARSYLASRDTVRGLAQSLFHEASRQAADRTRGHLGAAAPALDTLTALERRRISAERDDSLIPRLDAVLRANPGFTWVSYGDADGAFAGVWRPAPGQVRENRSRIVIEPGAAPRTELVESDLGPGGARIPVRREADTGYDPRTRPFYTAAVAAGGRTWIEPYVFAGQNVPGITCAAPQLDERGAVAGVYTVDFDLGALSRFVAELAPSARGSIVIFTGDHQVLAHSRLAVVGGGGDDARILDLDDLGDPVLGALVPRLAGPDDRPRELALDVGDERWLVEVTPFEIDGGLRWYVGVIAPEDDFLGEVQRANRTSLWIGGGALLLLVLGAWFLANRIARPLDALARDMDAVGRFELDDARPGGTSVFVEIARMQRALAQMKGGLGSFARFVPRDLVRKVLASGREADLGGEIRELTVFFSDIAGFTTLAEQVEADVLVAQLGGYLDEMTRTIAGTGGTVDKFVGDGIVAFWGAPADDPRHAAGACVAALRCQRALTKVASTPGGAWLASSHTRIGLATGPVLVGNIGTPERLNYTVMGDAANLAARLESLNKQYGTRVMVSESTRRAAGDAVIARAIDVVAVKGKVRGVRVYELLALPGDDGADEARALEHLSEQALDAYLARDFAAAIAAWDAILARRPGDLAATTLRERALAYQAEPPPPDWSGVFVATSK